MKRILLLLASALVAAPLAAQPPVTVETDTVQVESVAASMWVSGVVVSREDAMIASELDGRVTWIAEVGDRVAKGSPVARLDTHLLSLEKREREAAIAALQANLVWMKRQTERLDELAHKNNTAQSERDEMRARYLAAQQELTQAQVGLERTEFNLRRSEIPAPFDGVVVSRATATGEYATVGKPLLRLVNTDAAEVSVTAPLRLARFTQPGHQVFVSNQDSSDKAIVRSLVAVGDERSHMMELRITPTPGSWLIGEAVTVELAAGARQQRTTVDRDALVLRDSNNYVYVVDAENTAKRVIVEVGDGIGERIAVSGWLEAGDRVIIRGAERLRDGQKVAPMDVRLSMNDSSVQQF